MVGARHQAPSSLRACDRLPSARLQPLDAFAGDPEALLSSPATLLNQILCVQPAILLIAPSVNTTDVRRPN